MARIFTDNKQIDFKMIMAQELDQEGKYTVGLLGFFPVHPFLFQTEELRNIKNEPYYEHILTEEGFIALEKMGLKHPGRGYVKIEPIDDAALKTRMLNIDVTISNLQKQRKQIEKLLKYDEEN